MIDLEQEFEKLKRICLKQISDKISSGELTDEEADRLIEIVHLRMDPKPEYDNEGCPDGHDYDCGWSSSMGYHCT